MRFDLFLENIRIIIIVKRLQCHSVLLIALNLFIEFNRVFDILLQHLFVVMSENLHKISRFGIVEPLLDKDFFRCRQTAFKDLPDGMGHA